MQELPGLAQPQSLDLPRALFENQNLCRQVDQRGVPAGKKPAGAFKAEIKQPLFGGEAVIVERIDAVGDVDVVTAETGCRLDPPGAKTQIRIAFEKCEGQHLTGAVGEEMPV